MQLTPADLDAFWSAPWSLPLRNGCRWLARQTLPVVVPTPAPKVSNRLRPLCVQRWVGQAVAARLAWMRANPDLAAYRYAKESMPCWTEMAIASYDRRCLRELSEGRVLWLWGMEVERLLRIVDTPPELIGERLWALAVLGVCEHLSYLYAELKRRHKAMPARALLREEMRGYVEWDYRTAA